MELTSGQRRAREAMESGTNVFLTREAGAGKSFVIDAFHQRAGIAARNVSGRTVNVTRAIAELTEQKVVDDPAKPGKKKLVDKKIAQIVQYPLRLAYAITIHKSQGQTYSSPVVINPSVWAPGQLYVALSRCTDASKIHLARPLREEDLVASKSVIELYEGIENDTTS